MFDNEEDDYYEVMDDFVDSYWENELEEIDEEFY